MFSSVLSVMLNAHAHVRSARAQMLAVIGSVLSGAHEPPKAAKEH